MSTQQAIQIADPPKTFKEKLKWIGPGFLWMVSAAGSGELLFTPRVGSLYGYSLLWAMLAAVILKWFINREVGRYAVCTGRSIIDGLADLPGPKNWALYVILIPQLFVAVTGVAGLAASSATALALALPGDTTIWTIVAICSSTVLVTWGRFNTVEKLATILAVGLGISAIAAAVSVFPNVANLAKGMVPRTPPNVNYGEVLPWLGFMLTGAAGLIWYSFWIREKGYGMKKRTDKINLHTLNDQQTNQLGQWIRQMTADTTVGVGGTVIVTLAFLILGVELLKPKGLIPEEEKVAEVLGGMLTHVWGPAGFWFMVTAVFVGFWDTVLSNQDGFGRMFGGGIHRLIGSRYPRVTEKLIRRVVVVVLVTILPIVMYLFIGEPVQLLKIGGAIEVFDIPVLVALVIYLNYKTLPASLRPSRFALGMNVVAGLFFSAFAVIYILQIIGVVQFD
jgi:Mn2+/Fe2+ NRAMP family transporter